MATGHGSPRLDAILKKGRSRDRPLFLCALAALAFAPPIVDDAAGCRADGAAGSSFRRGIP